MSCKSGFTINGTAEMTCTDGSLSTAPTCPKGKLFFKTLLKKGKNYMVMCEIGDQKAKRQIPNLFLDVEFPNLFQLVNKEC